MGTLVKLSGTEVFVCFSMNQKVINFYIAASTVEVAVDVSRRVPELSNPYDARTYHERLAGKTSLILAAFTGGIPIGFKVGYDKDGDGSFYSWMGGVVPEFRNQRVALAMAQHQEQWAKAKGFHTIKFKTRNSHKPMLVFALRNGFSIVDVIRRDRVEDNRIVLSKTL
jgi:predicted GNAT superfamily acetyltransferase